jgi:hypothetical protein
VIVFCEALHAQNCKPAYRNRLKGVLRGVMEECEDMELITAKEFRQIKRALKSEKVFQNPVGAPLDAKTFRLLLKDCENDEKPVRGVRDAALLVLAARLPPSGACGAPDGRREP